MVAILKNPLTIILILVVIVVVLNPVGNAVTSTDSSQNPEEIAAFNIGDTVLSGENVVNTLQIRKVPVIYHPEYILSDIETNQYYDLFSAIVSGTVNIPISQITGADISKYGTATGFSGPGVLIVSGQKLVVKPPDTFVWAYKTPSTYVVKDEKGVKVMTDGKTVKTVSYDDISNSTIPSNFVSSEDIKSWYNQSNIGDQMVVDYSLAAFNDGRNDVPSNEIVSDFGTGVLNYMSEYPSGDPVMVYEGFDDPKIVGTGSSVVGYYAQYNNILRAYNSKQMVIGWNNTIIPPHSSSTGQQDISFTGVYDPSTGESPSHGACPPGRALRAAVMEAGSPLPSGMTSGFYSVSLLSNPTSGISVYNPNNFPMKIVIWTVGSGTTMQIYCEAVALS